MVFLVDGSPADGSPGVWAMASVGYCMEKPPLTLMVWPVM